MSWLDRIAARAGVERDWNTGVNTSAQTSAPADDSAWKYISAGDIKGLADYTNREYNYHNIPYIGQGIGHTANNATMGLANLAQFLGADSVSNYLYEKGKEGEAQLPEYREPELSLSYALDPNGLLSAGAMVAGSMLSMAPVAALAPVGGIAAGAARLAGNVPKVGGLLSNFAPGAVRWATTGPIEAMMEGGGTEREMLENGASREAANAAAWDVFKKNAALLTATNALEGGLLGKLGVKTPTFKNPVANGISRAAAYAPQTAAEAVLQGYEEGAQEGIQAAAMGNGANTAAQILNPSNWTEGQWDAAKMGFAGGLPIVGGMAIARRLGNRVSRPSSDTPMKSSGDENIDALIAQAAEKYGVPVNLLHSIAQTESEYNQDARSEAGAIGMMQLMPDTAAGLWVDPNDLAGNIEGGAKYMRELLDTFDGDLEKAVAAYNAGPNAVKKHGGIPPYAQTQDYVRKVLGGLDGYDTSVPQRMRNLVDDAAPYIGVTMDNGTQGCVEAVTKIGAKSCPFLAQELENGVVNVDRLVEHAGDRVIPFDPNSLEEGDVIVYGDGSDPQLHVVLYDGKGGYIGNSTERNKVVQDTDYTAMGTSENGQPLVPTKIIKTGAQFGGVGAHSIAAPVMPDFTGLIADEKNLAVTQEAIQNLINTDRLTPAQHAAILQAAEMIRDTPIGDSTDPAVEAENVNEWQSLIDRKDIKGIFEKDPQKVVQTMTTLGKEQRAQKTRAAIENQQQIEETKQAIAAVQTQANTQPVQAAPMQSDQSVQQIVPEQTAQPMMDWQVSSTVPHVGDIQVTTQTSAPIQPENVMQMPQEVPPISDAFAAGLERGVADAVQTVQSEQPHTTVSQEELAGILSKVQQWEQPLLSIPEYVAARNRQDWAATARIARAANVPGVAQFYDTLMEHGSRNATNITPYAPQQSAPPIAVPSAKAPVPVVGVRPSVPTRLPDNIEERRALGRSLGRFMTDNKINIPKQLGYDLAGGRGKAIQAANDKITAWEEKRAEQEADVNTSHAAQENTQGVQNTVDNRMLAQRGTEPKNGSHIVREKSAQNQVNKKAADKGGVSEGASVSTEPESLNEPSETPSIHAPSSTSTISSEAEENKEKPLSENEREAVKGLSADAKNVYQMVRDKLTGMKNKKVARAASAGAVLLARHADIIARKIRATLGTPFTAMDYYRTWFDLRYGGEMGGFTQALNAGVNLDEQVPVVDISAVLPQKKMSNKDVLNFLRGLAQKEGSIPSADGKAMFDLEKKARHVTYSSRKKMDTDAYKARQAGIRSIRDLINNAVLVESTPNRKTSKKPNARAYHRFYVPVKVNGKVHTIRIVGEESGNVITLNPAELNLYDVIIENRGSRPLQGVSPFGGSTRASDNISIRDMLTGVKDADGNVYAQREMQSQKNAVRKQYKGTAQWMKAPNGEETNLTEDQWLTVRTPAFKAWFGDWENDPKNASKVLDENDEPLVVYHGSDADFDVFDKTKGRANMDIQGMFFSPWELDSKGYGANVRAFFLNIRKPANEGQGYKALNRHQGKNGAGVKAREDLIAAGFDGVNNSDEEFIAFEPNQIKSVDNNGAFSPDDTNIFHQSAWHGTPHDFDGFDLGAIGTGEGAQVHGWGLYFAKERKVSEGYKRQLTRNNIPEITLDGVPFGELTWHQKRLLAFFDENGDESDFGKQRDEAIDLVQSRINKATSNTDAYQPVLAFIESNPHPTVEEVFRLLPEGVEKDELKMVISWGSGEHKLSDRDISGIFSTYKQSVNVIKEQSALLEQLNELDVSRIKIKQANRGKLYEVDIPDSDVLLDEQKPFDEQPKLVQEKLAELYGKESTEEYLNRIFENPYNDPALRIKFVTFKSAKRNIEQDAENVALLRDVLDRTKSPKERTNIFRDLDVYSSINPDHLVYTHSDDLQNIEASRPYLEKMLAYFEEHQRKQERSYAEALETLRGVANPVAMLHGMNGRAIYTDLSRKCGGDKDASLVLNEVGIKGITYVGGRDGRCFVVFDDKAISIIEKFNQQMNEIVKGTTQDVRDGQRIVSLFEEADESTFLHEMGHLFLLDLERLADMSPTSAEELQTVRKWAAWSEGQAAEYKGTPFATEFAKLDEDIRAALKNGNEKTANKLKRQWEHERFARGFERYLQYGEAPTKGLRAVFAKFRAFLQRVYQAFTGTGGRATPEVEAVMARMISIQDSSDLSAYPQGKKTAVYTDSGKKIPVQYRVVSADDLIASHDAGTLEINPGYPVALQPRDRERVMMRQQVTGMANNLRPEDLADGRNLNQGAPLIRSDGVVLNGNGRTIAIQRAQVRNKERAAAYRDYLVENAAAFGFSKEEIEGIKNPVLVREVQVDISDGLMQDIIGSTTGGARMGASEAAQQDAEKITYAMMDAYVPNDKGDLTTAANRSFVAGVLHKLVGKDEMNAYLDKDGHPNADGIQRVKRALFALAYGDDELIAKMAESTDDDIRNVSNGMMVAAPMVARLAVKKGVPYVKELQDAITDAVKQLDTLRRSGESVKDYLSAQALFTEHEDSAEMRFILETLDTNKRSGKKIATFFSSIAETLDEMETPSGNELFDAEMPSLMDVLEGVRSFAVNGGQDNLFDEYIVKEANALYNEAAKKFPDITDKEVADHVREAIQLTLDFGQGGGEIRGAAGSILSKTHGNTSTGLSRSDDYRSSRSVRQESAEKDLKRGKIYGLGITRKLVNDGAISLVGQKAETAADLAEIAQVLRHPGYEKFHYVYVDDSGNVKFHETVTSGLPGYTTIFMPDELKGHPTPKEVYDRAITRIRKNMKRSGATRFYIMHNHPSGDPHPSRQDFAITRNILNYNDMWRAYAGHVILDHNQYALIDNGLLASIHDMAHDYEATYDVAEQPHNALGVRLSDEDASASVANMYATEAETTAFFLGSDLKIRGVQKIHDNFKDATEETQTRYLRHCARVSTGRLVVLATSNEALYQKIKKRIEDGRDEGFVDVVLMKDGRAQHPEEKIRLNPSESWLGVDVSATKSYRVLENAKPYGEGKQEPTLAEILQLAPALKKAALEYGAKDERGKVTFADEMRKQEFLKVAKALLSAAERKTSARRQESLKEMLDGIRLIPPTRVSPRKRVIADWGREMGVSVVFFKGDPSLHGFHQDGVTFLNVDSVITPQWTFWHEAMHWMKANNPDIYSDLVQEIHGAEGFTKAQLDAYRNEIGAPDMSDADVIEEMIADTLPDVRRRVPLLREVGRRDAGVVQRVVAWIRDVMRRFHDHFHTPKGGLTSAQRVAMTRAFGNLVGSIRDAEGKAIFRIENEGARITLRNGKPLPAVKFSLDKAGRGGDNESRRNASVEMRNQAITDSVTSLFRKEVDALKESGLSEQEIARVLGDENSDLRMRVLAPWLRQYDQFQARYPDKRGIVNRIEGREATDRSLSNEEISRRFDTFKARMERMIDDAGLVYAECAYQRAGRPSFTGFHSWQRVEQSIREHGGNAKFKERPTTETKTSLNTKHLENQGAFSTPKLSDEKAKKDAAYRDAVKVYQTARDTADRIRAYCRLKELVREAAAEAGFVNAIPEQTAAYKVRVKAPPQKTVKVYKVFTLADDGSPTALFIGGTEKLPQGVWLDAQDAYHFRAKNGLYYVPSTQNPYTQGGKTGASVEIPNEKVRRELIAHGFLPKDSSAAKVTALAYRPGWHAGTLPFFPQGGKKAPQGSPYPNVHRYNQVVFECEMSADKDNTHEAESQPKARTKNGSLNTKKADLQYMPEDGYYFYATNPLTHGHPELGLWAISGSLKINRALSQEECDRILMQHGMTPQGWEQGRMNLSDLGYVSPVQDAARKTLAPITYDDNGHVVPLSERFNPAVDDIRFSANTQKRPKGNFTLLKDRIRSFVGVAPADNLELPGRVQRTVTLSPKDLEKRIRERWIQEKNIISKEKQKDGKIAVTYYPDTHDVGYADYVKSVRQVAKRNPFVKVLYDLAHKAMKKQEKLRNEFGKALKEFNDLVKNEKDLKSITDILWQGDAEGRVFSDAELRALGANERVIKAYNLVRRELEKAYKMLRDAQTQVKTRSQTLEPESVESFKKSHWIEDADVISAVPRADGMVLLTWRGGRTYDVKGKTMDAEALELMKKDENVNVTSAIPKGDGTFSVSYVERIKPVFRRTGYMPHFFHEWMIYEKYKDPKTGEERYTSVASGRTMNEAVKIGNEIAKDNADKQYVLRPKGFDLGTENAVVVGDMDFAQMSRKLAESTEISLADARSLLLEDAGASLKSRHRFFGSLLERKDGKGFDQDVQWVLAHYFNGAARYIAMEDFKPAAISMYERFFGRFDDEPKNLTAQYCKNLINDVNGNPRGVEVWLNELIKKTPIGKYVADSFGDRVALALNGELSTWNAITKLGLFNFASAAVNFSQFINVGAALNDYGYAMKGLKRALNPSALDEKIIEASGLLNDINMADDNGGYTQRRGGKVRGIYSALKKGGEWTLIPFQKADTLMRKAAVLGAYYQGIEQKGMKTAPGDELSAEALAYAQEINDGANFDYSSANAPNMLRAGSVVTQQLFQFQKYPIMQFEFMYNILKNGTRGQKVRMFVPYVLFCGIGASIPFGALFNQLFSFLFGLATGDDEDITEDIKAEVLRWAGKDPAKKAIAETALYGVLAPTFGLDISGRIGMSNAFGGEFYGKKPESVGEMAAQQLGGPAVNSAVNMFRQFHEGNPIEALKAVSPALGNMAQAWVGESRTTRHRVNVRYDTAYDKIAHALGFRSVEESKNAFIMNYEYEQRGKAAQIKREAIQDYIADPSDENRRTINALGITDKQIKEARIQQERTALERAREGRPKTSNKSGASRRRKEEAKRETLYDTLDDE